MRRESYLSQPSAVEVYPVFSGTDVIMRKNIELVDKEDIQDGKKNKYKVWECEEVQFHYQGKVTQEEIESDFDYWYAKGGSGSFKRGRSEPGGCQKSEIPGNRISM